MQLHYVLDVLYSTCHFHLQPRVSVLVKLIVANQSQTAQTHNTYLVGGG